MDIDRIPFFQALAVEMNAHPERYQVLGDADMSAMIVMERPEGAFAVRLDFEELRCAAVTEVEPDEPADFRLVGPIAAWHAMFDDITAHGHATGLQTINSLALLGDHIACRGDDPMGLDKFSRFNQTLQEFFDGAAHTAVAA
ncbi:MAG: hypothetical protein ACXVJA_13520 [Acidimicrobiia bacterium]